MQTAAMNSMDRTVWRVLIAVVIALVAVMALAYTLPVKSSVAADVEITQRAQAQYDGIVVNQSYELTKQALGDSWNQNEMVTQNVYPDGEERTTIRYRLADGSYAYVTYDRGWVASKMRLFA